MSEQNVLFKKVSRQRQVRKRRQTSDGSSSGEESAVVRKDKVQKKNPMIQMTTGVSRKQKPAKADSSDSDSDNSETEERAKLLGFAYESSKTTGRVGPRDQGATATLQIETEWDKDSQAQFERAQQAAKDRKETGQLLDDKVYRGMNTYGQFVEKKDTAAGNAASGFVRKGPIRAPAFHRQTVLWDYKPDLCKDYKETGFCTFGDSCKFLHDRTDYKHGWELEREVREGTYGEDDAKAKDFEISDDEDELPFKCFICRESFTNPVITKCKHYFCEKCALEHYRKSQKCYVCDKQTYGVFNPAKELINRLGDEEKKKKSKDSDSSDNDDEEEIEDTKIEMLPVEAENDEAADSSDESDGEQPD